VTVEFLGTLPVVILLAVLLFQTAATGLTFIWTTHAATAAAHQAAITPWDGLEVRTKAQAAVPSGLADDLTVSVITPLMPPYPPSGTAIVTVSAPVPVLVPGVLNTPWNLTVQREVVTEP
jgi:pilus assembly protein CpaE